MIALDDIKELLREADDNTLTLYLDVNPAAPDNQAPTPQWRIWLRNTLHDIESGLQKDQMAIWHRMRPRVEEFFQSYRPQSTSLAVFFGSELLREYPLQVPLQNRSSLGPPLITPLLWALDQHEPYLIALVDREEARLLTASLGRPIGQEVDRLKLDTSQWHQTTARQAAAHAGRTAQGSSRRDDFARRVDEHEHHFWRQVGAHLETTMNRYQLRKLILSGPEEATTAVRAALPERMARSVVGILSLPPRMPDAEALEQANKLAESAERRAESSLVDTVMDQAKSAGRGALGKEPVLDALQRRMIDTIVAAWPAQDEALLEQMAREAIRSGVRLELVRDEAADALRRYDGLAALLRYVPPPPLE
ncbi:MAG: hypothetical protein EPO21_01830 [Chloroflexota bacterium]|nr:MAG: hypothetical protein EPO21_01830 [Chloroflexota bacterium]